MSRRNRRIVVAVSLILLIAIGLFALQRRGVSQTYTLQIAGEQGREVVGDVTLDGVQQKVRSRLPFKLESRASRLDFAFAPVAPDNAFQVHVHVNGEEWGRCNSPEGVKGSHQRTGIPGWGINGGGIGGLSASEVAALK